MVRWNKKICIQYLAEMRSPLEEASASSGKTEPVDVMTLLRQRGAIREAKRVPRVSK